MMLTQPTPDYALADSPADRQAPRDEVAQLLRRYPNLSELELARLINLYRGFSALDMALMLSDPSVEPAMDRFSADHRSKLRTPLRHYAALLGYALLALTAVSWAAFRATGA